MSYSTLLFNTYQALVSAGQLLGSKPSKPLHITDQIIDIARGKVKGARQAQLEGYIKGISSGTSDVSELVTPIVPTPSLAGETMQVKSTSNNDTILGTNSRSVIIEYIEPVTEQLLSIEVELNGTTAVTVPVPIAFVSDFYVKQAGSLDSVSAGDITLFNGTTVYCIIKAGGNKSLQLFRYIPKGKNLFITGLSVSGNSKTVTVRLRSTISDNLTRTDCYIFRTVEVSADGANNIVFDPPMIITAQSYLKASIFSTINDTAGAISVGINGWLENDDSPTITQNNIIVSGDTLIIT